MVTATARHILVSSEDKCNEIKQELAQGGDFAKLAKKHSTCPSGKSGGDLGAFGPGMMVPEFNAVCFNKRLVKFMGRLKLSLDITY